MTLAFAFQVLEGVSLGGGQVHSKPTLGEPKSLKR